MLNLREAAELAGTTKSSIWRAIRAGRLSCTKDEYGGVHIDPAEIARVYPPKPPKPERVGPEQAAQTATDELRMRNAALEAEVRLLREMADSLKAERDRWAAQAERLALSPPIVTPPPPKEPAPESPRRSVPTVIVSRRGWSWPWRRAG
jgi:hypothetical protein